MMVFLQDYQSNLPKLFNPSVAPIVDPSLWKIFGVFAREYDRYSNFLTIYFNCTPEYFSPLACINCGFKLELILHDS